MTGNRAIDVLPLASNWRMVSNEPSVAAQPSDVDWSNGHESAVVPGTVGSTLLGTYQRGNPPTTDYDDLDWWYECEFSVDTVGYETFSLALDGLATIAEVWLNGESVHTSRNMFRGACLEVTRKLRKKNTLSIVFRSINHDLKTRRPRGRWKTNLVSNQQLRWIRTTVLGRIPAWTPPVRPVGPWRDIRLICNRLFTIERMNILASLNNTASVDIDILLGDIPPGLSIDGLTLSTLGTEYDLPVDKHDDKVAVTTSIEIGDVENWCTHDIGAPTLHDFVVSAETSSGPAELDAGTLAFRSISADRTDGRLALILNGETLFARGACWTTGDIVSLSGDPDRLRHILELTRDAGANMLRIGGTMVYESDLFYDLCDELGIAVWQDFMFANMDYPTDNADFLDDVTREIEHQLGRLRKHPCIVAFCGGSEVEQQAAMFGLTEEIQRNPLFYELIPDAVGKYCPGVPYFPSSPCEGDLPFHNAQGPAHYFGVGAYKQDFDDLYKSGVKFATECLAFSNVPSDRTLRDRFGLASPPVHHPDWKAGVPRDSSAGWDFEDIRDHYIKRLYDVDPVELRYYDMDRYIAISKVVTGEVMQLAYDYWRSDRSRCNGGLIWFLNDIVPGAGWGLIDSDGNAKPVYHFLKRSWANVRLNFVDRGMDGVGMEIANDSGETLDGALTLQLLQGSRISIASASANIHVQSGERASYSADRMLGRFFDVQFRYRFGQPKHDVTVATLEDKDGSQILVACTYPDCHNIPALTSADTNIECVQSEDGIRIRIRSDGFLQHVELSSATHDFGDNYFHVAPNADKFVLAKARSSSSRPFRGILSALNLSVPVAFK